MLRRLHIRDFATVASLELELAAGMTVLTGETGAGKSILIDAIGLLLGDRGDSQWVRNGRDRAELSAEFDLGSSPGALEWARERDLQDPDQETQCILRRTISAEGRSRATVNGSPVPITLLRELGEQLLDIHGQHEHQLLLRADVQRQLLDDFGDHEPERIAVREACARLNRAREALESLQRDGARPAAELELLRYQAEELEALDLDAQPIDELEAEHHRLSHAGELMSRGGQLLDGLNGDEDSIADRLGRALAEAEQLAEMHEPLGEVARMLSDADIQVREAADALQKQVERLDLDPQRLQQLDQRLERLHDVARKHRARLAELPSVRDRLQQELSAADAAAEGSERLQRELRELETQWRDAASALSNCRRRAAEQLQQATASVCKELGMGQARLSFQVDSDPEAAPSMHGFDRVAILFSANPGQAEKPLARIASGGELSRVSLAIQVSASRDRALPVMIFDEVDAGVGGAVAQIVGEKLRALADGRQVLCVTHLPQVAAQAHQQLLIDKEIIDGETCSRVTPLDADGRRDEIARMLGGVKITEQTRRHAEEMLAGG